MKHALLVILLLAAISHLQADSWGPPTPLAFMSANGKFLLHISPKALGSFPELPEDREENDKQRKALGLNQACHATLFQKDDEHRIPGAVGFRPVWQQKLVNEIGPMEAYISDDGQFVVTTDDYGRLGYGDNVVVIYNAVGKIVRRYKLTEFIPQAEIKRFPQSVSSIQWAGGHSFDTKNGLLLLQVWRSGNPMDMADTLQYRTVSIRLSTGEILKEPEAK